jgi:hypothetical protein
LQDTKVVPDQDANEDIEMGDAPAPPAPAPADVTKQDAAKPENNSDEDIIMEDAKPSVAGDSIVGDTTTISEKQDSKASNLNINTNVDSKPTDDPAPMTANTDLDSLFQDPDDDNTDSKTFQGSNDTSTAKGEDNPENDPFSFDVSDPTTKENPDDDLDQSTFRSSANGGDNDNLSSLLPGLQDYANTDGEMDGSFGGDNGEAGGMSNTEFDALFGDATDAFGSGGGNIETNNADNNNTSGGGEDPFANPSGDGGNDGETFNFEAFMNSTDFDTEGHNAAAVAEGGGGNGQGGGEVGGAGDDNGLNGADGQAFDFDSFFH